MGKRGGEEEIWRERERGEKTEKQTKFTRTCTKRPYSEFLNMAVSCGSGKISFASLYSLLSHFPAVSLLLPLSSLFPLASQFPLASRFPLPSRFPLASLFPLSSLFPLKERAGEKRLGRRHEAVKIKLQFSVICSFYCYLINSADQNQIY